MIHHLSFLRLPVLGACLITLIAAPAMAVDWDNGAGTTDFNDPINWTTDALPGTGADPENAVIGTGNTAANPATVDLNGPLTTSPIGDLRIGDGTFGDGTFNHSSGALVTAPGKWSFLGVDGDGLDPAKGVYNLSGDASFEQSREAFSEGNQFHLGLGGGARDPMLGDLPNTGELNVSDNAQMFLNNFFVGSNDGNLGTVNQSGGAVFAENWVSIGREGIGTKGVYNMTGGQLAVTQDGITVGESSGATGEMTLSNDSIVDAGRLRVGRSLAVDADTGVGGTGELTIIGDEVDLTVGFLDIGSNDGALTNGEGTLEFIADDGGISTLEILNDVTLNDGSGVGFASLVVDLTSAPAGNLELIDIAGTLTGTFMGLAEGAAVPNSGGRTITYVGGDGNDIVLLDASAGLAGDYDNNGVVDAADYTIWRDGNSPDSSQAGYDAWANNYGATSSSVAVAVPEPTSIVALLCGLIAAPAVARRR
ncbi:hypothetical protein MalM25_17620 [Planctomycetes bacterium MalM25]|nr:hypothetical protein MalM25_17620 [Planctomycetes bacterium MalM25]